nr:hypothetical protein [Halorussus pelagicus]
MQKKDRPARPQTESQNNIDSPTGELEARGDYDRHVSESSAYTETAQRRSLTGLALAGLRAVGLALYGRYQSKRRGAESREREEEQSSESAVRIPRN